MGHSKNNFKVPKKYSPYIDKMIDVGSCKVDKYATWLYMFRLKANTRTIDVTPVNGRDIFLITPEKKIEKRKEYGAKHDYYKILP